MAECGFVGDGSCEHGAHCRYSGSMVAWGLQDGQVWSDLGTGWVGGCQQGHGLQQCCGDRESSPGALQILVSYRAS